MFKNFDNNFLGGSNYLSFSHQVKLISRVFEAHFDIFRGEAYYANLVEGALSSVPPPPDHPPPVPPDSCIVPQLSLNLVQTQL